MKALRHGLVAAPILGALWTCVIAITVSVAMSFATGDPFRPALLWALLWGALAGGAALAGRLPALGAALGLIVVGLGVTLAIDRLGRRKSA